MKSNLPETDDTDGGGKRSAYHVPVLDVILLRVLPISEQDKKLILLTCSKIRIT